MNKIFISYSHLDEAWKDRLVPHFSTLQKHGVLEVWHDRQIEGGANWFQEIEKAAKSARMAILLISENFFKSTFIMEKEVPWLRERQEKGLVRILPLIVKPCEWNQVDWLQPILAKPKDGRPLSIGTPDQIDADLRAFAREAAELLSRDILKASPQATQPVPPDKIYLSRLPTTRGELFGREQETAILCNAWTDPHTNILTLVAWGGVGKTALVNEWLNGMAKDNYRGAERVYGWSFYSQGTREDKQVAADEFLAHALIWFGDQASQAKSPWDKGVRLAELLRQQKTLLILDGVEPLQYPPGPMQGRLKDQGLQALLKELAHFNPGLCVVTTRVALADLSHKEKTSAKRIELEHLSPEAGTQLLKSLNVKGTEAELRAAAAEFAGHALALNLLGSYLAAVHNGEIRKRDLIPQLTEDEEQGGHARRVMESYERWLTGTPEFDILYLMGLFDRPAAKGAIDALLAAPPISGLTTNLQNLPLAKLQYALKRLRDLHLLAEKDEHHPDTLDCHPLVREHFGEKLRKNNPTAWKEAHSRLYKYYKNLPTKHLPDTLEEMEPLFAAVAHGCQAGFYFATLHDIFVKRIKREDEDYLRAKLGSHSIELQLVSNFFDVPWTVPANIEDIPVNIDEVLANFVDVPTDIEDRIGRMKAFIFSLASNALRPLGRLQEAFQTMRAAFQNYVEKQEWHNAAPASSNLSRICLITGDLEGAIQYGQNAVDFTKYEQYRSDENKVMTRANLANALHNTGKFDEAIELFAETEFFQRMINRNNKFLISVEGFNFCDLLLDNKQFEDVINRANWILRKDASKLKMTLGTALSNFCLGITYREYKNDKLSLNLNEARNYLNEAVDGFRKSGFQEFVVRALVERATLNRVQSEFAKAEADLEEAREIAERGEMNLYLADYHLEACRLCLAQHVEGEGQRAEGMAKEHLETASAMIEKMGYGRRQPEVEALRREFEELKI